MIGKRVHWHENNHANHSRVRVEAERRIKEAKEVNPLLYHRDRAKFLDDLIEELTQRWPIEQVVYGCVVGFEYQQGAVAVAAVPGTRGSFGVPHVSVQRIEPEWKLVLVREDGRIVEKKINEVTCEVTP